MTLTYRVWQLHAAVGLLLVVAISSQPTRSIPATWDWDQFPDSLMHSYSREATSHGVKLPYQKSREECYNKADRVHNTVITVLLQHQPGNLPVISTGSIQRVLDKTPADVVLFHTGWSQQDIETHVKPQVSFPFEAKCIANVDWSTGHRSHNWEALETGYQGPGYRSMCRWYSRRVSVPQATHGPLLQHGKSRTELAATWCPTTETSDLCMMSHIPFAAAMSCAVIAVLSNISLQWL